MDSFSSAPLGPWVASKERLVAERRVRRRPPPGKPNRNLLEPRFGKPSRSWYVRKTPFRPELVRVDYALTVLLFDGRP